MIRRWLAVLLWVVSLSALAHAGQLPAADDERAIRFNPPPDYCMIKPEGRAFERLKGAVEADNPGLTVRLVFVRCDVFSGPSRHVDQFGFAGTLKDNTVGRAGDLEREKWLRTRALALPKDPAASGSRDSLNNAVLVVRRWRTNANGLEMGLDATTMTRNTPLVFGLRLQVAARDGPGLATAYDRLRPTLRATAERFAKDNAFAMEEAPSSEQTAGSEVFFIAIGCLTFGAIVLIALMVRHVLAQIGLSVLLVMMATLFAEAAPGASPMTGVSIGDATFFAVLGLLPLFLAKALLFGLSYLRLGGRGLPDHFRRPLSSSTWLGASDAVMDADRFTRRWFVTVAAATGSIVFALVPQPQFFAQLVHAVGPSRIVFTFLIAVVSLTLIGPVEEFIFESRLADPVGGPVHHAAEGEEESRFQRIIDLMSPQAILRFALVLVFMMMLTAVHSAFETRVHEGSGIESLILIFAGVVPGVVSYLWCAALQRGAPSVAFRSGLAAGVTGVLLVGFPLGLLMFLAGLRGNALLVGMSPGALALGFVAFGGLAFSGGLAIDYARRRRYPPAVAIVAITCALLATTAACVAVWNQLRGYDRVPASEVINAASALLAVVGWAVGLFVSGFPSVLKGGSLLSIPAGRRFGVWPAWRKALLQRRVRAMRRRAKARKPAEKPVGPPDEQQQTS